MRLEDILTTALDALALVAVAVGIATGLWPLIAGWSVACGGVVVFLGVRWVDGSFRQVFKRKREAPR